MVYLSRCRYLLVKHDKGIKLPSAAVGALWVIGVPPLVEPDPLDPSRVLRLLLKLGLEEGLQVAELNLDREARLYLERVASRKVVSADLGQLGGIGEVS